MRDGYSIGEMPEDPTIYPIINACLNALAAVLLSVGMIFIQAGNEKNHKRFMLAAFVCSTVFLCSYLYYHFYFGITVAYAGPDYGKIPYFILLGTHTILAAIVPFLAIVVIRSGLKDNRVRHRKWAKILFPIWIYVSITGVSIYLILYVFTESSVIALGF
ncbi:MAG: uncharacterized membrane protein YozB (DUF420 family) [Myxococcota bacterium]|jgi:uncharacterized membrane protein YozB (DUF420 family)